MSYRSDIRIATTKQGYDTIVTHVANTVARPRLLACDTEPDVFETVGDTIVFGWDEVRWYDIFDDENEVETIESSLDALTAAEIPWQYFRIGEDTEDVEDRSYDPSTDGLSLDVILECKREINVYKFE